jgi:hypothetical protein
MIIGLKRIHRASSENGAALTDRREPCIWIRTDAELTVVTISGAIDASDIDGLSHYARGAVRNCDELTVSPRGSGFIAIDGLRALLALWLSGPAATERSRAREVHIRAEGLTVTLRFGG